MQSCVQHFYLDCSTIIQPLSIEKTDLKNTLNNGPILFGILDVEKEKIQAVELK